MTFESNTSDLTGTAGTRPAAARRRGLSRLAVIGTAAALAVGALTATAHATATPAAHPLPGGGHVHTAPQVAAPKLDLGKLATGKAKRNVATSSGWVIPSDLVYQGYSGTVDIEGNDQPGGFTRIQPSGTQQYRQVLDIGDVNGDNADDILTITGSGHLQLVYGNGQGAIALGGGWQIYNQVTVAGDINGDGRADLIARDTAGRLWYYASNNATGTTASFAGRKQVGTSWNIYDQVVGVSHFDSANASLVARDLQGKLWLYDAKADGTFGARKQIGTSWNIYNQIVSIDANADGHSDLVGRTLAGALKVYTSNGAGGTSTAVQIGTGYYGINVLGDQGTAAAWGKGGIEGRQSNGNLRWYGSYGNGRVAAGQADGTGWVPGTIPVLTEANSLNDNGTSDLVVVNKWGDFWNVNNGSDSPLVIGSSYNKVVGPGDLNSDGKSDLIARDKAGKLWFIPGTGTGFIYNRVSLGAGWNIYNRIIGSGDLTNDGIPDLMATTPAGAMYIYPGKGNGGFGARILVGTGWQGYNKLAAPGDLTGDGKGEVVGVDSAGRLWEYPGLGHANFGARVEIGTSWNSFTDIG